MLYIIPTDAENVNSMVVPTVNDGTAADDGAADGAGAGAAKSELRD